MKDLFKVVLIFAVIALLQRCTDDDAVKSSSTRFVFTEDELDAQGIDADQSLFVTVQSPDGNNVLSDHELKFDQVGEKFVSQEINLPAGNYTLSEISVGTREDRILQGLQEPLNFAIGEGNQNQVSLKLFRINPRKTDFQLGVLDKYGDFTDAVAYIKDGDSVVQTYPLRAKLNKLSFDLDASKTYKLLIEKAGYAPYEQDFLFMLWAKRPVKITLKPCLTVRYSLLDNLTRYFSIGFGTGSYTIHYGDGTSEVVNVAGATDYVNFEHDYPADGIYYMRVTGDIDMIYEFNASYDHSDFTHIDLQHLSNLKGFHISLLLTGPDEVDFTHNPLLESVSITGCQAVDRVILPPSHNIALFDASGPVGLNTLAVDEIIDNLYANTVSKNITGGFLNLNPSWWEPVTSLEMVGPPSASALEKIYSLHDDYGWNVLPIDEDMDGE